MSFKENLKAKIRADGLLQELISTMKEPPGKWWVAEDGFMMGQQFIMLITPLLLQI